MYETIKQRHSLWQRITTLCVSLSIFIFATSVISIFSSTPAQAATSNQLNFQGRLLSPTGTLVPDGIYNMEFNLYYQAVAGSTQWTEDRLVSNTQGVTVQNGYFSVYLGEYDAFPALDWSEDLYLGMTVRGTTSCVWGSCAPTDAEMSPRFKLTSVPYAFRASNVASSNTNSASLNSDGITITTGNALGATSNSGNISVDTGTAMGTTGSISLGSANASALNLGRSGLTTVNLGNFTIQGGTATLGTTGQAGSLVVSDGSSNTATIQVNALAGNYTYSIPTTTGNDTFCLETLANCGGGGSSLFTDAGTFTYLTASTDDFVIGDTTVAGASLFVDESAGSTTFGNASLAGSLIVSDGSSNSGTLLTTTLGSDRTYTLPDESGTFCLTSGNCAGVGGTGDILNNGQNGTVRIGSNDANSTILESNGTDRLTISSTGASTFSGTLAVTTLGSTDNASFLCRNSSNILAGCNYVPLSASLTDNIADAFDLQEGTNNYININTTDSSENISFGNSTTNPSYFFLGSGTLSVDGAVAVGDGLTVIGNSSFSGKISTYYTTTDDADFGNETVLEVTDPVSPGQYYGVGSFLSIVSDSNTADYSLTEFTSVLGIANNMTPALTIPNMVGVSGQVIVNGDVSTVTTNGVALLAKNSFDALGSITNGYGLYVENQTSATNDYGVYVAGADTYALFVDAGVTRLDGAVEIQGAVTLGTTGVAGSLGISDGSSNTGTILLQATSGNYNYTIPTTTANDVFCLVGLNNCTGSGVTTIGAIDGQTKNANGAVISGSSIYMQTADVSSVGLVSIGSQTFNGVKTFDDGAVVTAGGLTVSAGALAVNSDSITSDGATLTVNAGGTVDIQDAVTVDSLTADTGNVAITSGVLSTAGTTRLTNAGALQNITTLGLSGAITGATATNTINGLIINSGALSGISTISLSGAISGGTTFTGSGNINTTAGAFQLNGNDINTAGTLTNVAYENQANTFTAANIFQSTVSFTGAQFTNSASTLNSVLAIGNDVNGGDIGASAAATVDVSSGLILTQTTAGQTMTLYSPTSATAGRIIYVTNSPSSSTSFILYGVTLTAGSSQSYVWNGSAWTPSNVDGSGSGVTTIGAIDGQTKNANGAVISGSSIYMQTADVSSVGLVSIGSQTFNGVKTFDDGAVVTAGGLTVSLGGVAVTGNSNITGTLGVSSTLTASNGLTVTTGAVNITGTSGALALSGLGASSINTGANALTITSSNLNTTATGINSTAIGATTASTGAFTTGSYSGALAANGGITFDASTDTLGAFTLAGTLDANTNILTNIGNTGTDFVATTGALNLAGILTANGGISIGTQALTGTTGIIDYTDFDVSADGLITLAPDGGGTAITVTPSAGLTTGLDVSNANITNGVSLGATTLLGTTATINFNNFDVSSAGAVVAVGVNSGAGLLQGTAGLTVTGNTSLSTTAGNTVTAGNTTGLLALTGSAGNIFNFAGVTITDVELNRLDGKDANLLDVNDAVATAITGTGALNAGSITSGFGAIDIGADTITSGLINGQTISAAANFTGTLAVQGASVTVGTAGVAGSLVVSDGSSNTGTILVNATAGDYTFTIPTVTANDTFCLVTLANCSGSATTLQGSYTADVDGSDAVITLTATDGAIVVRDAASTVTTLFVVEANGGSDYFSVTNTMVTAGGDLTVSGGEVYITPVASSASTTEGTVYYDSDTDRLLVYANGKWQADRADAVLVAASNSSQADKDAADYVADGNGGGAGDGDQVQINSALTAGSGKKVVLLAGTYVADATISIPNNTTMAGVGAGTIIELADLDATDNLIENTDTTTGTGVIIRDLKIDGRDDLNTAGTQSGIYLNTASNGRVENVWVEDFRTGGILLEDNSHNNVVTGNKLSANDNNLALNNSDNNVISDNYVVGSSSATAITVTDGEYNSVADNTIDGSINSGGIELTGASYYNSVTGNTINGATTLHGIMVQTNASANIVTGNTISSVASTGIVLNFNADGNNITGNTITSAATRGIYAGGGSDYNVISSNTVTITGGATTNEGIHIDASDYNNIIGNTILDSACTTTCYAINILNSTSDYTYLADNNYRVAAGTDQPTINDAGTNTRYASQLTPASVLQSGSSLIRANTTRELTGDIDPAASTTVTGTSTKFTTELIVGDRITVSGETRTVTAIASDTSLTVDTAFSNNANDTTPDKLPAALVVQNSAGANTVTVSDTGSAIFRNSSDSTTAFNVQDAAGTNVFSVNTTTAGVTVGGTLTVSGANLTSLGGALTVTGVTTLNGNITLGDATSDTITFTGRVNSDVLPSADDTYDLGSSSLRWQDLYLGPASLHVYCSAAECTSARDWSLGIIETNGATEGNLNLGLAGASNLVISTAGNVGLGTAEPGSKLELNIGSDLRPSGTPATASMLRMQGGQSANIWGQRWDMNVSGVTVNNSRLSFSGGNNSSGSYVTSEVMTLHSTGVLGIGTTETTGFSNNTLVAGKLNVRNTMSSLSALVYAGSLFENRITVADANSERRATVLIDTSVDISSGTLQNVQGLLVNTRNGQNTAGATVTYQIGIYTRNDTSSGSTTSNSYGIQVATSAGTGTITNSYGILIDDVRGTNDYAILQSGTDDSNVFNGTVDVGFQGAVTVNGVCHSGTDIDVATTVARTLVACSAAPNDYAEFYPAEAGVEAGDIVATTPNMLTYEAQGADAETGIVYSLGQKQISIIKKASAGDSALGIISTAPYQTIGKDIPTSANRKPLALSGRVPVKVNNEGGAISAGDKITLSSVPGVGRKATANSYTVGTALQSFSGTSGVIYVMVSNSYYAPPVSSVLQGASLDVSGNSVLNGDVQMNASLNVSGPTTVSTLTVVGNTTIQQNLVVLGNTTVQSLTVNGKIITTGATPTATLGASTTVGQSGAVTITGNDTAGSVSYTSGAVNLPTYNLATGAQLTTDFAIPFTTAPRIALTPKDATSASVRYFVETTTTGFTVHFIDAPTAATTYTFDYIVIQ